jgi:uncharacterized surface protein with fasciclin (FAS1) repeats
MKNLIETATAAGNFSTLLAAVKAAGLTETLSGTAQFTVFAPTDAAFKKLPAGTVDSLLKDVPTLKSILKYHVASGKITAKEIKPGDVKTLEGTAIVAAVHGTEVTVNGAKVTGADVLATNGVIHVIDTVLMPKSAKLAAAA